MEGNLFLLQETHLEEQWRKGLKNMKKSRKKFRKNNTSITTFERK